MSRSLGLARSLALAGASAAVRERKSDSIEPSRPFADPEGEMSGLGVQMREALKSGEPGVARLIGRLGLSEAGYWTVLLCAATERYPEVAAAFSILAEDERVHLPTAHAVARLVSTALDLPYEVALLEASAGSNLETLRLCETVGSGALPLSHAPIRLTRDESRVQLLRQTPSREASNRAFARERPAAETAFPRERVELLRSLVEARSVTVLRGARRATRQLALDLGSLLGEEVAFLEVEETLPDVDDLVRLRQCLCVIDLARYLEGRTLARQFANALEARIDRALLLVPSNAHSLGMAAVDVPDMDAAVAARVWSLATDNHACAAKLAQRYRIGLDEARVAVESGRAKCHFDTNASFHAAVNGEVLAEGARKMGRSITTLPPGPKIEDLVVPALVSQTLTDMMRAFEARSSGSPLLAKFDGALFGRGVSALFSGSPGTGKTYAARCLASSLGLNLYRIDLSQVVSKYIGETEKALARVFEEAEAGHGVLLFDEADALFGKRSEVKDAHDRYANVEVAYLLQRMESFDGMSVLTTNLRNNIDTAFIRRLRYVVEFPVPDRAARETLWKSSLPDEKHWDASVDVRALAHTFALSGGDIFNVARACAYLAAGSERLTMAHVVRATYRELEKVGLPRTRDDFGALAVHLPPEVR
ncbi:MAG: ATP-binding protein [Myxococcales bacterium]|nr:ATP-binding protein [Myxococcales bacterium]